MRIIKYKKIFNKMKIVKIFSLSLRFNFFQKLPKSIPKYTCDVERVSND